MRQFRDRVEAGKLLASLLTGYGGREDVLVLGLPRGGVPVAYEVARALDVPLDVLLVRKLGVPGEEELAMGAIASGGVRVLNRGIIEELSIPQSIVDHIAAVAGRELERRERLYRGNRPLPEVRGKTVIVVDDGLATGSTMRAALRALRRQGAAHLVVAVPTAPAYACAEFGTEADECVCADLPERFHAVGASYEDFSQTSDAEVKALLELAARRRAPAAGPAHPEPVAPVN